jgi:ADP-dependent NAD(P)H-hydrate dehydratase / NAD(P)H-hydrate epimerase
MWAAARRPLSSEEMAVVEQNAVALGVTIDTLMENAGRVVAEEAARHLPAAPARLAVIASTGNNGGDGTCAAFYLHQWGYSPEIWLVRPPSEIRSRAARRCYERIEHRVPVHPRVPRADDLATMPLVVDALLGTGQSKSLRSPIRDAVDAIRASRVPVLSIDLPTGVLDPQGLRPSWTVALTCVKSEMTGAVAGEVTVRDIGLPEAAWRRTGPGEFLFFHPPDGRHDRGRSGRVVIIGGGPYAGAPSLAGLAALRSGAERATILAPGGAAERIQSFSPNLIVRPFGPDRFRPTDRVAILEFLKSAPARAVILGMGAGAHPETLELMGGLIHDLLGHVPLIVDADAIAAIPNPTVPEGPPADAEVPTLIATPNSGEFARVFRPAETSGVAQRAEEVRRIAAERRLTLLVKGDSDIASDGTVTFENAHHHPAMTVGGVGDVLAGVVGSLLAQGLPPLHAARLATYWTGEAGLRAAASRSFGLLATDVIDQLPNALVGSLERLQHAA